jgi:cytidylate kinase
MKKHVSIAIDGPSGAGKSTIARQAAKRFGYIYADTGAIYRAVGLSVLRNKLSTRDENAVSALLPSLQIDIQYSSGERLVMLNGENVNDYIRTPEVSMAASDCSALPAVRNFLLDLQRKLADEHSVVMDGRDIGTVVLPNADLKIFLTADASERARRRYIELTGRGETVTYEDVLTDINIRDKQDSSRAVAPLKPADDSVIVDTTKLTLAESIETVVKLAEERLCF